MVTDYTQGSTTAGVPVAITSHSTLLFECFLVRAPTETKKLLSSPVMSTRPTGLFRCYGKIKLEQECVWETHELFRRAKLSCHAYLSTAVSGKTAQQQKVPRKINSVLRFFHVQALVS